MPVRTEQGLCRHDLDPEQAPAWRSRAESRGWLIAGVPFCDSFDLGPFHSWTLDWAALEARQKPASAKKHLHAGGRSLLSECCAAGPRRDREPVPGAVTMLLQGLCREAARDRDAPEPAALVEIDRSLPGRGR